MTVFHIVAGQSSGNAAADQEHINHILSAANKCVLPDTGERYVKSVKCGCENSGQGFNKNLDLVFVFEFESVEHRDYFRDQDPIHKEIVEWIIKAREGLDWAVLDFEDGQW